jgi:glycosyltransferase involved in cell wall biosynthesis
VPKNKIEVIRYGRDIQAITSAFLNRQTAREKLSVPLDATVVGTLARLDAGKGSRELFNAVTELMKAQPDLHLLMIGPPTSGDPKATELDHEIDIEIAEFPVEIRSRIHKRGRLDNGTTYLKAFDLFILATYKENFALTLLEAQLAEVPCLATDSGGSPDVVQPEKTGWLFKPESKEELKSSLKTALAEKQKWPTYTQAGKTHVEKNFAFNEVLKSIQTKLKTLVTPNP